MTYLITFILAFILVLVLVPLITGLAHRRGWYDAEGGRKIHSGKIPRIGGIGLFLGFMAAFPLAVLAIQRLYPGQAFPERPFWLLLAVGLGYHGLGLVDDFRNLSARLKLVLQLLLAILVVAAGFYFRVVEVPVAPYRIQLGFMGPVLTVFWILGIVNAVNLIDGMDGLAAGISLIGAVVWAVLYFKAGQYLPALAATATAGAVLGFLFYNFPPATIFMGDS
ncbi:MAG: undecaprenyl/decaprenyl-phosphate alpha-N-acetylglucosaminyl 1-phosphate transferase, partial [Spirochaetaceae bacterium]|nr:undecaprenyl/decaprenyl-phosphate alpha-N-acetylglucosaminyl 1-phosphate transferase [Spirochaetaceae bacterium]